MKTPVVFIIFNRPDYTQKVWQTIKGARPEKLFVVADGPRDDNDDFLIETTRKITEDIDWPCEVKRLYAEKNLGSRKRISGALTEIFKEVDKAIILEDDCLPDPTFFSFCEMMLELYEKDQGVMAITGSNPFSGFPLRASYDFSKYFSVWGWATWSRAWKFYDDKMADWPARKKGGWLMEIFGHRGFSSHLRDLFDECYYKDLNSWAARWFYSCLVRRGLCVIPEVNLVSNIGVKGVHSSPGENNNVPLKSIDIKKIVHPKSVDWNKSSDIAFFNRSFPWRPLPGPRHLILKTLVFGKKILKKIGLIK